MERSVYKIRISLERPPQDFFKEIFYYHASISVIEQYQFNVMGDENESFFDNIILEGIRSDHEIPICRIGNTPNTPLIESTPYLP